MVVFSFLTHRRRVHRSCLSARRRLAGYWASNLYAINAHFGSAADLRALSDALHARGMYLMVDIVGNHMGEGDTSTYTPFNQAWQYHDCAGCPADCNIHNFFTYPEMEHCRLANLPDLNHQQPSVRETLLQWAVDLVANYSIDGLRIDTVPEVRVPGALDVTSYT